MKRPASTARATTSASAKSLAVIVTLFVALFLAVNHCELGALTASARAESACCAKKSAPAPLPAGCHFAECCAALAGPLPVLATVPPAPWLPHLPVIAPARAEVPPPTAPELAARDGRAHGPPGGIRFLQVLGSRSVPAHGPPAWLA